uniref:immunoglobulin-like domain-containing protein n=1 Tax=Pseudomonas fluorescens TaxID=294 RepID=UPI0035A57811
NDAYQGNAPVTNSITAVSGGNYENLTSSPTPVSTAVTDVTDTSTVTLTATSSVAEGGTIVYTASVGAPVTGTPVVVSLSNGQAITIAVGQSSGSVNYTAPNDAYQGNAPVTNSITSVTGGNYENLTSSPALVSTAVTDVTDTSTVTLTATPSVTEGGTIVYTASVGAPVTGAPVVVSLSNGQAITIAVGQSSGSVNYTAPNDAYQGNAPVTNSITAVSGGNYENLTSSPALVSTAVTDVTDTSTVTLTATPSVTEGGTIVYTASVGAPVTGVPVLVTLANGQAITIAVGQSSGSVNYTAPNDAYQGNAPVTNSITSVSGGNYENLTSSPTPVSTAVTDVADTSTVTLTATSSVAEGGTVVYTASVDAPVTGTPIVVSLSNGQSITIAVGQSSGSVNYTAPNDAYQGNAPVTNSITGVSGGNYENLISSPALVNTAVTDVTDTSTVTLTATPSVAEGGTVVYTASVDAPVTGTPVVVSLSNGQAITIAVGQSSGSINYTAPNDAYQGNAPVLNSITGVSGGNYENLASSPTPVSTAVTDVTDTSTVTLTATPNVAEGGAIVYTASVEAPVTGTPVVVSLSNGQAITIAVGQSSGSVNYIAPNDAYQGNAPVTNSITSVSGGNYENLTSSPTPVSTAVTDVTDTSTVTLTATPSVTEGGTIVYTASVGAPVTGTPVVVSLSNGQAITIAVGQSSGSVNYTAPNDAYQGNAPVTNSITGVTGGNYENLTSSPTPVSTAVTDVTDTSTVTLTATPSVAEGGTIVYTASVEAPVTGTPVVVSLSNGQAITIAVGQSSGSVNYTAPNDAYQGNAPVTNSITAVSGGNYENLTSSPTSVSTAVTDVTDTSTVTLTATPSVAEGGTIVYTASVAAPVTGTPVVVSLSNGQTITIAVGQSSGSVNYTAPNDAYQGNAPVTNSITGVTGGNYENLTSSPTPVSTAVTDVTDTSTVTLTATSSVAEGGSIVYTASVGAPVTGTPVLVNLSNGQSITIAVGQSSGSISYTAPNDVYQGNAPVTNSITAVSGGNYENLTSSPTPVSTAVTDVTDTSTVTLTATPSVAEGGTIVYTASVAAPVTGTPVVVSLSNGQAITIAVGQSSGSVNYTAPNDAYQGNAPVTNSITGVTGGNYENLTSSPTPVSTAVTDVTDTSTVTLTATPSVAEGGTIVYTASVEAPVTGTPVIVTLANGQAITIAVGQSSGSVNYTAPNDAYQDNAPVTNSITSVSGGNYENLTSSPTPVSTAVTDVTDTSTVTLTATPSVAEGGTIVYTASVDAPVTGAPVVVSLSNGQAITIAVGQSLGSVNYTAPNDAYQGNAPVTNSITGVTGGNYENLTSSPTPVSTAVTDVADTSTVILTTTPSVVEGGTIVYTASVSAPVTGTPVVVSLSNGQAITIAVGQSSGSVNYTAPNDAYQGNAPVTNSITSVSGGNYENLTSSPTPVSTAVTDVTDTSTVTLTATPSVAEGGTIVYTASVSAPVTGTPIVVSLSNGQSITIAVSQSSGSINYTAPNDVYQGNAPVTNSITGVSGGNYENLTSSPTPVSTAVTDVTDTSTVTLIATPSVVEGGTIVYTASVGAPVTGTPVVVSLSNGQAITIAVGQSSGSVNYSAPNDAYQGNAPVTNTITGVTGGNYENLTSSPTPVSTAVTDVTDTSTVTLTATPSVAEGGTIVYTASVGAPVTGSPVVVSLSNGQAITIAVGQSSGSVNYTAPNDAYQGNAPVTNSITSVSGGNYENLTSSPTPVITAVTDVTDTSTVTLTATPSVAEGGTIVYTASVAAPVTGSPVVVSLSNGQAITIAVGQSSGSVNYTAPNDAYQGNAPVTNSITGVSGGNYENLISSPTPVSTAVADVTDTSTVTLTATPSVAEGGTIVYTASVDAPVTGTPVLVNLSNGQSITIAVGQSSGSINYTAPNDVYQGNAPVTNSITSTSGGNYENLTSNPTPVSTAVTDVTDTSTVTLTATPSVAEGGIIVYTASVGAAVTGSPVTVALANGQSITIAVGQSSGTVNALVSNDVYKGHAPVTNSITGVSGGNYENLVANPATVNTSVTDVTDRSTVSLTATPSVAEGGSILYTASVTAPVTGTPVVVTLANGESITIAVGASSGTVSTSVSNDVYQGHAAVSNSITAVSGGSYENLVASPNPVRTTVTDTQDTTTISLSATPTVAEGGSIVYTATLTNAAGTAVNVILSTGQLITVAAGQTSASVSVAAPADDVYLDTTAVSAHIASASGGNFENLAINSTPAVTQVTDTLNTSTVTLTATPNVAEGGAIIYTAAVSAPVTVSPVVVTLANGQSITIAVGASSGSVSVVVSNDVYQGHAPVTNSITSVSGGNYENLIANSGLVSTAVTDTTDNTTLTLTGSTAVVEGATASYTLTLSNPAQTDVTVKLSYTGTATNGSDYTGVTTVLIKAGTSQSTFSV